MRAALNENTFFNTIALARQASNALILVVEGDDDHFMLRDHISSEDVLLIAGIGGRVVVLDAASRAERHGIGGARFLIDAEYDLLVDESSAFPPNVLISRSHDVPMDLLLVSLRTLDRVINSHCRSARRRGIEVGTADARNAAVTLARQVALVRIANERNSLGLRLADFPFGRLPTIEPTLADVAELAVLRTGGVDSTAERVVELAQQESDLLADRAAVDVVGDHDFFAALSAVLRSRGVMVGADALWTSFLSAFGCDDLARAPWFSAVSQWAASNSRQAFSCPCAA